MEHDDITNAMDLPSRAYVETHIKPLEYRIAILENAVNLLIDDMTPIGYKLGDSIRPQRNSESQPSKENIIRVELTDSHGNHLGYIELRDTNVHKD